MPRSLAALTAIVILSGLSACGPMQAVGSYTPSQASLDDIYHPGQNNDFGSKQDEQVIRAARAAPTNAPMTAEQTQVLEEEFGTGQNNDFGSGAPQHSQIIRDYPRTASTVPMVGGKHDLVGDGGQQDELAREIYTPGRGTSFGL